MRQAVPDIDEVVLPNNLKLKELEHTVIDGIERVGPIHGVLIVAYRGKKHKILMEVFLKSDGTFDLTLAKTTKNVEVVDKLTELLQEVGRELNVFLLETINEDLPLYSKYRRWYGLRPDSFSLVSDRLLKYALPAMLAGD